MTAINTSTPLFLSLFLRVSYLRERETQTDFTLNSRSTFLISQCWFISPTFLRPFKDTYEHPGITLALADMKNIKAGARAMDMLHQ